MTDTNTGNIVVVGTSGHAKVVADIIEREGKHRIVGLIDSFRPMGDLSFGYRVLGAEEDLPALVDRHDLSGGVIAIGDNWTRYLMAQRIMAVLPTFDFVSACHPSAQLARGVTVGRGTVVMAGAIVNSDSAVGEFCIVNTRASLDHDGVMEDFSSLAPSATTGGNVRIGAYSAIGLGAAVIQGRTIGTQTVIGAGAVVLDDVPDLCVAYGVPAKVVRKRREGEGSPALP